MIKVENLGKDFMCCQSCNSNDELVGISVGLSERQTLKVRLCKKCLAELNKKINA